MSSDRNDRKKSHSNADQKNKSQRCDNCVECKTPCCYLTLPASCKSHKAPIAKNQINIVTLCPKRKCCEVPCCECCEVNLREFCSKTTYFSLEAIQNAYPETFLSQQAEDSTQQTILTNVLETFLANPLIGGLTVGFGSIAYSNNKCSDNVPYKQFEYTPFYIDVQSCRDTDIVIPLNQIAKNFVNCLPVSVAQATISLVVRANS